MLTLPVAPNTLTAWSDGQPQFPARKRIATREDDCPALLFPTRYLLS